MSPLRSLRTDGMSGEEVGLAIVYTDLMFSRHGFKVTLRQKPDLRIELDAKVAYTEENRFREKKQDRIDKQVVPAPLRSRSLGRLEGCLSGTNQPSVFRLQTSSDTQP